VLGLTEQQLTVSQHSSFESQDEDVATVDELPGDGMLESEEIVWIPRHLKLSGWTGLEIINDNEICQNYMPHVQEFDHNFTYASHSGHRGAISLPSF
jgi:hypothetical protein